MSSQNLAKREKKTCNSHRPSGHSDTHGVVHIEFNKLVFRNEVKGYTIQKTLYILKKTEEFPIKIGVLYMYTPPTHTFTCTVGLFSRKIFLYSISHSYSRTFLLIAKFKH